MPMIKTTIQSLQQATEKLNGDDFQEYLKGKSAVDDEKFMADLATRLWRIRCNMWQPGSQEPHENIGRSYRHLERLIARLEQSGIRIEDKTGERYEPGMLMIKAISFEPMAGIGRDMIKETVMPAVFRDNRLIQHTQVVIGTPVQDVSCSTVKTSSKKAFGKLNEVETKIDEDSK